jgi:hypothetical protein
MRVRNMLVLCAFCLLGFVLPAFANNIVVSYSNNNNVITFTNTSDETWDVRYATADGGATDFVLYPHTSRSLTNTAVGYFWSCGAGEWSYVRGTFMTEPAYGTPDENVVCGHSGNGN